MERGIYRFGLIGGQEEVPSELKFGGNRAQSYALKHVCVILLFEHAEFTHDKYIIMELQRPCSLPYLFLDVLEHASMRCCW